MSHTTHTKGKWHCQGNGVQTSPNAAPARILEQEAGPDVPAGKRSDGRREQETGMVFLVAAVTA